MKDLKVYVEGKVVGFEEKSLNGKVARIIHILQIGSYQLISAYCKQEDFEKMKKEIMVNELVMAELMFSTYDNKPGGWFLAKSIAVIGDRDSLFYK